MSVEMSQGVSHVDTSWQHNVNVDNTASAGAPAPAESPQDLGPAVNSWNGDSGFDAAPATSAAPAGEPTKAQWDELFDLGWNEGRNAAYEQREPRQLDQDGTLHPSLHEAYALGLRSGNQAAHDEVGEVLQAQEAERLRAEQEAARGNPAVAQAARAFEGTAAGVGYDEWCLLFVQDRVEEATGRRDPNLWGGDTGNAVGAMRNLDAADKLNHDMSNVPIGAAIFWSGGAHGHVAIAAGRDQDGKQLVTTTGWPGYSGVRTVTLDALNAQLGRDAGGWYLSPK